jgi:hypothetical protein
MCFNNGVVDFKQKVFRNGVPEDRLSKCTNIDYVSLNPDVHKHVNEIEDLRENCFPTPTCGNICGRTWLLLIGTSADQTFNMYIGIGQTVNPF